MSEPLALVPGKPDPEIAAGIKKDMVEALGPVLVVLDRAIANGFVVSFAVGPGPLGKQVIAQLKVLKEY